MAQTIIKKALSNFDNPVSRIISRGISNSMEMATSLNDLINTDDKETNYVNLQMFLTAHRDILKYIPYLNLDGLYDNTNKEVMDIIIELFKEGHVNRHLYFLRLPEAIFRRISQFLNHYEIETLEISGLGTLEYDFENLNRVDTLIITKPNYDFLENFTFIIPEKLSKNIKRLEIKYGIRLGDHPDMLFFSDTFPNLEMLRIEGVNVKLINIAKSTKLKYLEIKGAVLFDGEIKFPSLLSFKYNNHNDEYQNPSTRNERCLVARLIVNSAELLGKLDVEDFDCSLEYENNDIEYMRIGYLEDYPVIPKAFEYLKSFSLLRANGYSELFSLPEIILNDGNMKKIYNSEIYEKEKNSEKYYLINSTSEISLENLTNLQSLVISRKLYKGTRVPNLTLYANNRQDSISIVKDKFLYYEISQNNFDNLTLIGFSLVDIKEYDRQKKYNLAGVKKYKNYGSPVNIVSGENYGFDFDSISWVNLEEEKYGHGGSEYQKEVNKQKKRFALLGKKSYFIENRTINERFRNNNDPEDNLLGFSKCRIFNLNFKNFTSLVNITITNSYIENANVFDETVFLSSLGIISSEIKGNFTLPKLIFLSIRNSSMEGFSGILPKISKLELISVKVNDPEKSCLMLDRELSYLLIENVNFKVLIYLSVESISTGINLSGDNIIGRINYSKDLLSTANLDLEKAPNCNLIEGISDDDNKIIIKLCEFELGYSTGGEFREFISRKDFHNISHEILFTEINKINSVNKNFITNIKELIKSGYIYNLFEIKNLEEDEKRMLSNFEENLLRLKEKKHEEKKQSQPEERRLSHYEERKFFLPEERLSHSEERRLSHYEEKRFFLPEERRLSQNREGKAASAKTDDYFAETERSRIVKLYEEMTEKKKSQFK